LVEEVVASKRLSSSSLFTKRSPLEVICCGTLYPLDATS
jgi:hypothetical protein